MFLGREHAGLDGSTSRTWRSREEETLAGGLSVTTLNSVRQPSRASRAASGRRWRSPRPDVELEGRDPRRADGGARRRADAGARPRGRPPSGPRVVLISHNLHDIFEVPTASRSSARKPSVSRSAARDHPAGGRRGDHGRTALQSYARAAGGTGMSAVAARRPTQFRPRWRRHRRRLHSARWTKVKSGEIGVLPIFVGLISSQSWSSSRPSTPLPPAWNFVSLLVQTRSLKH